MGIGSPSAQATAISKYRPDIDGLRAIAVLSVVLFHINESLVPGGFVGVDIFFVISGFLITSIIDAQMIAGRFSFAEFYRRRILRIAPAYFAVTLTTLVAGCLFMLPEDLVALAKSALWSTFSAPNLYFWLHLDTSYFAPDTNQVPLLHLWSLGVEEQFYFVWPASLLLLSKFAGARWRLLAVAGVAMASFFWGQQWASTDFPFAYYMLPARAGELLVGALLALALGLRGSRLRSVLRGWPSELLALCGYALVAWGLYRLDSDSRFPGFNALYPSFGTAALILAGSNESCRCMKPLTWRPVVWIGLISYSLYLWHWPILAFTRYFVTNIGAIEGVVCLLVILLISTLSYRYIERPFRVSRRAALLRPGPVLGRYIVGALVCAGLSLVVIAKAGFADSPWNGHYKSAAAAMSERTRAALTYDYNCQLPSLKKGMLQDPRCVLGPHGQGVGSPDVILIGDSNAAHFVGMLGEIAKTYGFTFRNASVSSCPPIFGAKDEYGSTPRHRQACTRYREAVNREADHYRVVILGAQWSTYDHHNPAFRADLERTVENLTGRGKQVVLIGVVPRFQDYGLKCELRRLRLKLVDCETRAVQSIHTNEQINHDLRMLAETHPGVSYMDAAAVLCPQGSCSPYVDGTPVYYDPGHLSMAGSWTIGRKLVAMPEQIPVVLRSPGLGAAPMPPAAVGAKDVPGGKALPGGFVLPFDYRIVSNEPVVLDDGRLQHRINVHFFGIDGASAGSAITAMFTGAGFNASKPLPAKGGVRMTYRHTDGRWVTAIVWSESFQSSGRTASGRAYLGWIDGTTAATR